jgi:hypothetical protein
VNEPRKQAPDVAWRSKARMASISRYCPVCGRDDLEWADYPEDLDGGRLKCPVRCRTCGTTWDDYYQWTGIENLQPGRLRLRSAPPTD